MSDAVVLLDVDDAGVATVTLNRPDKLNAWTLAMEHAFFDALEACRTRADVRAVVITGAGRGFCAGADLDELGEISDAPGDQPPRDPRSPMYALRVPKPVVAAINGACAGMGFVQMTMCDVRFAARGAKLTSSFARRGLVAEHGLSWTLPRLVGPGHALDLLMSGRVILAEEAHAIGLVERLSAPGEALQDAQAYARELATLSSPASMAAMKAQVYADLDRTPGEALADANVLMERSLGAPDLDEGVRSFTERRAPAFAPLDPDMVALLPAARLPVL